jgi:hypothetical protein
MRTVSLRVWTRLCSDVPYGHLAQQVVLHLELLHLAIAYFSVLAVIKVGFDFVPRAGAFVPQCDFDSAIRVSNRQ